MAARRAAPTLVATAGLVVVLACFLAGADPLVDNSFLTHLATGRTFWRGDGLPHEDPYTFTAAGEPWVVQSWLPAILYGAVDRFAGLEALRLLTAVATGALGAMAWALTRPARTLTARVALAVPVVVVAFTLWAERPLLVGLAGLGAVLLALEGRLDPRWLVPILWVWVNSHGSWPLGFVVVGATLVGAAFDRVPVAPQRSVLAWMALGAALGALNPYGPAILTFPLELLGEREAISGLREWMPPSPGDPAALAVLLLGLLTIGSLRRRWRWSAALPALAFAGMAALSARNLVPAAFVLVAAAAPGLDGFGSIEGAEPNPRLRLLRVGVAAVAALVAVTTLTGDPFDDSPYPVAADRFLAGEGLDPRTHRIIARDYVGNWFEARYGPTGSVFVDDRVEVLPLATIEDHKRLLDGAADWEDVLGRLEPDAVLWRADDELAALLAGDDDWSIAYDDGEWVVALPG